MFCQNCGTKNEDTSLFCESCGAKLEPVVEEAAPVVEPAPVAEPQQYQAQPQQFEAQPQAAPKAPKAPKAPVKFDKAMIWPIVGAVEVIVLVVCVVLFFKLGNAAYSPDKTVMAYLNCIAEGNADEAFEYLDIDTDDDLLTKEAFVAANSHDGLAEGKYKYSIKSSSVDGDDASVKVKTSIETDYDDMDGDFKYVLEKDGKNFLFFPSWKITKIKENDFVVKDFTVYTNPALTVYLDGVEIPEEYITEDSDYEKVYTVPKLFRGTHKIAVAMGDTMGAEESVNVAYDNYAYSEYNFEVSNDMLEEASDFAYQAFTQTIESAMNGKGYAGVKDLYGDYAEEDSYRDLEDMYEDYADSFYESRQNTEYQSGITSIEFSNVILEYYSSNLVDEGMKVSFEMNYDYVLQRLTQYWSDEAPQKNEFTNSGYCYITVILEDGEWHLASFLSI